MKALWVQSGASFVSLLGVSDGKSVEFVGRRGGVVEPFVEGARLHRVGQVDMGRQVSEGGGSVDCPIVKWPDVVLQLSGAVFGGENRVLLSVATLEPMSRRYS